jgi:predicted small integral membrane protein
MIMERTIKIVMAGGLAFLCALITLGNLQDPNLNFSFVQHVLSMDTMPKSALDTHAMPFPLMWRITFGAIVFGEGLTAILFGWAVVELARAWKARARVFHAAKRFIFAGVGCGFLVWFVGFTAVGGEWFAMWQSPSWNGQQAAFRIFESILLVSMFIVLPDCEL